MATSVFLGRQKGYRILKLLYHFAKFRYLGFPWLEPRAVKKRLKIVEMLSGARLMYHHKLLCNLIAHHLTSVENNNSNYKMTKS